MARMEESRALFVDEEEFEFLEMVVEEEEDMGLSHWEFVRAADADLEEERHDSVNEEPVDQEQDEGSGSSQSSPPSPVGDRIEALGLHFLHRVDVYDDGEYGDGYGNHDDAVSDDEDGYDEDGYGLNDELVPWSVSDKFGRQRMRKLGKRGFTKMYNSKRSPYLFVRPGIVHGKHGLGLKHSF